MAFMSFHTGLMKGSAPFVPVALTSLLVVSIDAGPCSRSYSTQSRPEFPMAEETSSFSTLIQAPTAVPPLAIFSLTLFSNTTTPTNCLVNGYNAY